MNNENVEVIDFDKLDVYLIKGNFAYNPHHLQKIHQKSFQCWNDVWSDYYTSEHPSGHRLNSDEFTRQDEVLALFYKGECFGITFFKEVHWGDLSAPLDSYFELWPQEAIDKLTSRGKKILICSQFTVAKNFRGKTTDIQWKYVLFGFIMKRLLESHVDGMTGTMRVKRGMGRVSFEAGAVPLMTDVIYKDHESESVDLVAFFHKEVGEKYATNPYSDKFNACWERLNGRLYSQLKIAA